MIEELGLPGGASDARSRKQGGRGWLQWSTEVVCPVALTKPRRLQLLAV